ncbi:MAG: hypothetical protein K2Z81_12965, partial [Cyanobacteria bacterium]|nr:hypothetical protein [Cyanobacteriota bacterium]
VLIGKEKTLYFVGLKEMSSLANRKDIDQRITYLPVWSGEQSAACAAKLISGLLSAGKTLKDGWMGHPSFMMRLSSEIPMTPESFAFAPT